MNTSGGETAAGSSGALASVEAVAVGMALSSVAGGGSLFLSILGLAGVSRQYCTLVATLCAGCALVFSGATVAARYPRLLKRTGLGRSGDVGLWGGMAAELSGGIAGIVLAVLALAGIKPFALGALAIPVLGAALIAGSESASRLGGYALSLTGASADAQALASEAVRAATGARIIVGSAGIVLGILVLLGFFPEALPPAALTFIGFSILVSGAMISARMLMLLP